jgi:hypothetical protein
MRCAIARGAAETCAELVAMTDVTPQTIADATARFAAKPLRIRRGLPLAGSLALTSTPFAAHAETVEIVPLLDARLRYEHVAQDGLPDDADAVTLRIRPGVEAKSGTVSVLVEGEALLAIDPRYNSGLNGKAGLPLVPDPQNIELNRAQLQWKPVKGVVATFGRQRIILDDARFVGNVGWRQNEQTFDAVRVQLEPARGLNIDASYVWSVRTIWGIDGTGARAQAIGGDTFLGNVSYQTPVGKLTAFAYLVDESRTPLQDNSNQTYGARLAGSLPVRSGIAVKYALSYATQSDYADNPNRYRADYYLAEGGLAFRGVTAMGGYERLGGDDGRARTSFQTPLATGHVFQGWADKFLVTPPDGIADAYGRLGYALGKAGPFSALGISAVYHDFSAARGGASYGSEWDLLAEASVRDIRFTAKYASYRARGFATDTSKFWLSMETRF